MRFESKRNICESLASRLTVFSNGDIYPCQMCNQPQDCLGNVMNTPLDSIMVRRERILSKYTSNRMNYWYDGLCDTCLGLLERNGREEFSLRYECAYNEFMEYPEATHWAGSGSFSQTQHHYTR